MINSDRVRRYACGVSLFFLSIILVCEVADDFGRRHSWIDWHGAFAPLHIYCAVVILLELIVYAQSALTDSCTSDANYLSPYVRRAHYRCIDSVLTIALHAGAIWSLALVAERLNEDSDAQWSMHAREHAHEPAWTVCIIPFLIALSLWLLSGTASSCINACSCGLASSPLLERERFSHGFCDGVYEVRNGAYEQPHLPENVITINEPIEEWLGEVANVPTTPPSSLASTMAAASAVASAVTETSAASAPSVLMRIQASAEWVRIATGFLTVWLLMSALSKADSSDQQRVAHLFTNTLYPAWFGLAYEAFAYTLIFFHYTFQARAAVLPIDRLYWFSSVLNRIMFIISSALVAHQLDVMHRTDSTLAAHSWYKLCMPLLIALGLSSLLACCSWRAVEVTTSRATGKV